MTRCDRFPYHSLLNAIMCV